MQKKDCKKPGIALSSTCLGSVNIGSLCEFAAANDIRDIELSANISFMADKELLRVLEMNAGRINFYVHNYFPAPRNSFVLNLAHPDTYKRSLKHCLKAVDLCSALGIRVYSVHAGMAISPSPEDLGKSLSGYAPIDFRESRDLLIKACREIAGYASDKGVQLLIENNVLNEGNCPETVNTCYHFADPVESERLFPMFSHPNIGVLLDVGHLKVSAAVSGFEPCNLIYMFRREIRAVHLSDNNGRYDQNLPVTEQSWFWPHIPWEQLEYISLEIKDCTPGLVKKQLFLIAEKVSGRLSEINKTTGSWKCGV